MLIRGSSLVSGGAAVSPPQCLAPAALTRSGPRRALSWIPGGSKEIAAASGEAPIWNPLFTAFDNRNSGNRWKRETCRLHALQGEGSERSTSTSNSGDDKRESWMGETVSPDSYTVERTWDQYGVPFRIAYAAGLYGFMAIGGQAVCTFAGIDNLGGFNFCIESTMQGIGYAVLPMTAQLFILDDEVVKISPPARAIRDSEDEEIMGFFLGMSPWQFMFVVALAAIAEELFFRIAIQGSLAHIFLSDQNLNDATGIAALTGIFPFFAPFAQAFAAVLTAALTGSIFYVVLSPQDPTYVIAPVTRNRKSQNDLKKRFAAWYERRQLRKIYSPLLESLIALYLGFEFVQSGNILAPMVTHIIYSTVVLGSGLMRIYSQRKKLRQRTLTVSKVRSISQSASEVDQQL